MSGCTCSAPPEFRITSENAGAGYLSLRCGHCGGKAGRIDIEMEAFTEHVTNPNVLDPTDPEVAETIVEHDTPTVSLRLNAGDSPFMFAETIEGNDD